MRNVAPPPPYKKVFRDEIDALTPKDHFRVRCYNFLGSQPEIGDISRGSLNINRKSI